MKLYYSPGACSLAAHIVLEWLGIGYEAVRMDADAIKSAPYLALNPAGTVPLLQHGDFLLAENVAILAYLAEARLAMGLLGDGGAQGRARVMRWLAYLNSDVHTAFRPLFSPSRFHPDEAAAPVLGDAARAQVARHFRILDAELGAKAWLTGRRSVADPYLFVMLRWAERKGVAVDGDGNLGRFFARMSDDPGARAAIAAEEDMPA